MNRYILFISIFLLFSCESYKEITLTSLDNVKVKNFEVLLTVNNPNLYGVKIKALEGEFFAQNSLIGKVKLLDATKIKRKSENSYIVPLLLQLENGVLLRLVQLAMRENVEVKVKGFTKGKVFFINKKEDFEITKSIDGKFFNIKSLLRK